ncbi:MAG: hypothetical protein ABI679_04340 [Gemmatimonadota bacterium]
MIRIARLALVLLTLPSVAMAIPDLRLRRAAGPLQVYPDTRDRWVFYYPPGPIEVVSRPDSGPDALLYETRFTLDSVSVRSLFTLKVSIRGPSSDELAQAEQALAAAGIRAPELRPLPIRRLEAGLVYAIGGQAGDTSAALPPGDFEPTGEPGDDAYWRERVYTIRLDRWSAQLLTDALRRGGVAMSVGYAFFADGLAADSAPELSGSPEVVAAVRAALSRGPTGSAPPGGTLVESGATGIYMDIGRWPDRLQQVDLNAAALPGYALISIRSYDFRDSLRPGLYAKQVEVEALGVSGRTIRATVTFDAVHPDLIAQSIRFPYAVNLRHYWRYRTHEILADGTRVEGEWCKRTSWTELLDITSRPEDSTTAAQPATVLEHSEP